MMKNMLLGYFHVPTSKRPEALQIIGHILDFTDEEFANVNIIRLIAYDILIRWPFALDQMISQLNIIGQLMLHIFGLIFIFWLLNKDMATFQISDLRLSNLADGYWKGGAYLMGNWLDEEFNDIAGQYVMDGGIPLSLHHHIKLCRLVFDLTNCIQFSFPFIVLLTNKKYLSYHILSSVVALCCIFICCRIYYFLSMDEENKMFTYVRNLWLK